MALLVDHSQCKFDYVSGSVTMTAIDNDYVTVNLDNLESTYEGGNSCSLTRQKN